MTTKWEKLEGNTGVLTVEVDAAEVTKGLDEAFKKTVTKLNVPGFRKGKLPRKMFNQMYGEESLFNDALDIILPEAYAGAVEEANIDPVDRPEINIEQMEVGQNLIFTAKVTVKPEVKLGDYKGLEVEVLSTEVTDEDVANELKAIQSRQAELVLKEEGAVENGDTVLIDFEGFVAGEAFEGGKGENYTLEIGSNTFIPGFEEQLIGSKVGDDKEVEVSFPEEYHAEDLAGKPATFKVHIHEVKTKELPELNDEFAKEADEEVSTLDELTAKLRENLETSRKNESEGKLRDDLVEKATANAEVDIPEVMIASEQDRMLGEFEQRLQQQGMNLELYYQFSGTDEDALKTQMLEDAKQRVGINLTLDAIIAAENIEVTDEEIQAEISKMSEMYNIPADNLKQMLGGLDGLTRDLKIRKVIELLVETSKTVA